MQIVANLKMNLLFLKEKVRKVNHKENLQKQPDKRYQTKQIKYKSGKFILISTHVKQSYLKAVFAKRI